MKSVLKLTSIASAIIISGQLIGCSGLTNNNTSSSDAGTTGGTLATGGTSATNGTHTGGVHATGGSSNATGGSSSSGGSANAGTTSVGGSSVTGGSSAKGGSSTTGGSSTAGTGGSSTAGGNSATGGSSTAGGVSATGGSSTAGGVSATGGISTAGGASATGGSSTAGGVSATGGISTAGGNSATGGLSTAGGVSSTGGSSATATGGMSSTGGTSALLPEAAVLYANSPACLSCAQTNCPNYLDNAAIDASNGFGSCQTVAGSASAFDTTNEPWTITAWARDPYPVTASDYNNIATNGFSETAFQYCMDLLTCLVQSKCDQGILATCFCGSAVGTDCQNQNNYPGGCADPTNSTVTAHCAKAGTGPVNGACVPEEENALDTNSFSSVPTAFGDVTLPGGPANQLVNCIASSCATQCSM